MRNSMQTANSPNATAHIVTTHSMLPRPAHKPATTYDTAAITPTNKAYGNWVLTWSTWLQRAPAEAKMVVSEMGERMHSDQVRTHPFLFL